MNTSGRIALIISIGALAVSGVTWFQAQRQIDLLRSSQRDLTSEVASMRRTPILDVSGSPTLGPREAVVTLIEFSDYECPFCIRHFQQTWPQIQANYVQTGKIQYVFRDFPVDQLHPAAIRAHEAAHCAGEQNKFWDMHVRLFSPAGTHAPGALEQRATEAGVNLDAWQECVKSGRMTERVRNSVAQATELGASGTPSFFIGVRDRATDQVRILQAISGAQPFTTFAKALDGILAKLEQPK